MLERCDHNRFSAQLAERMSSASPLTIIVPTATVGRAVTTKDNHPPVEEVETTALTVVDVPVQPSEIDRAKEAFAELRDFLKDNPVFLTAEEAKLGAGYIERTRVTLKATRDERNSKTRPLLDELDTIRSAYDLVREKTKTNEGGLLERAYNALRDRLTKYTNKVEAERAAEAERLRKEAEERERIAREAERVEQDAIACADVGECTDVAGAIEHADQAFSEFKTANRQAAIAERNVTARFSSALGGKSVSARTYEVLEIDDFDKAIKVLGITPRIREAVLLSAKEFRTEFGELPAGITATFERRI